MGKVGCMLAPQAHGTLLFSRRQGERIKKSLFALSVSSRGRLNLCRNFLPQVEIFFPPFPFSAFFGFCEEIATHSGAAQKL